MTEPTELLPCPFCGAAAHFEMDEGRWEWVECESCGMQGNRSASLMEDCKPKLAKEWNRRTPQPTQAQAGAVPLTDNELVRRSRVGAIQTDENGKVVMWPAYYRTKMEDRFKRGWREAEQHHGIKGGQHG